MRIFSKKLYDNKNKYKNCSYAFGIFSYYSDDYLAQRFNGKSDEEITKSGYSFFVSKYEDCFIEINKKEEKITMEKESSEIKELRKDIEILLNIYMSNREMNRKEIKRFSEKYYDIIEKQNAKNTLKKRGK